MANKVNKVQNGDLKSNIIVLMSVFGKVGQKYYIQPWRDSRGRYADCVKRVNSQGDMILTQEELEKESRGEAYYIPENELFVIESGKTFNLDDIREKAEWEAIKNCDLIAPDRYAKDDKGNVLVGSAKVVDSHESLVISSSHDIVVEGLRDIYVIENDGKILVGHKSNVSNIKNLKNII